jgi:hypothetical protein
LGSTYAADFASAAGALVSGGCNLLVGFDFTLCSSVVCNSGVKGTLVVGIAVSPADTAQYHRVYPHASAKMGKFAKP